MEWRSIVMPNKLPLSIRALSILGIICGICNILIGWGGGTLFFIFLGITVFCLSLCLLGAWNLARIMAIIFSVLIISLYIYLIFIYVKSGSHFYWGVGLVFHFPIFFWSILCFIFLNSPNVKNKFH